MRINDSVKIQAYQNTVKTPDQKELQKTSGKKIDLSATEKKASIEEPKDKLDISMLKAEADKAHAQLRSIVEDLLKRQGIEIDKLDTLKPEDIKVDQQARDEAQQMIDEGGPLSPEAVSDRIVEFAKIISGGDKEKFDLLKGAIEEGFEQAKEMMGGELPEISGKTYDLIQEKFDVWENEE